MVKIKKYTGNKGKSEYGHRISFNFGHAKFTEEWKEQLTKLEYIGYERKKDEIQSNAEVIFILTDGARNYKNVDNVPIIELENGNWIL